MVFPVRSVWLLRRFFLGLSMILGFGFGFTCFGLVGLAFTVFGAGKLGKTIL